MGDKTLLEQIKTVCSWNTLKARDYILYKLCLIGCGPKMNTAYKPGIHPIHLCKTEGILLGLCGGSIGLG